MYKTIIHSLVRLYCHLAKIVFERIVKLSNFFSATKKFLQFLRNYDICRYHIYISVLSWSLAFLVLDIIVS